MLTTTKELCLFPNEGLHDIFKFSPDSGFFKLLYKKKYNHCKLDYTNLNLIELMKFELKGFLITSYPFANIFVSSIVGKTKSNYWISKEQFTLNLTHMIRKSLEPKMKKFIKVSF